MEDPPTSKRPAPDRSDDRQAQVCDGVRLDGEWKY